MTHFGVIALFSSNFPNFNTFQRKVLKLGKFDEKREITPKWVMGFTSKLQGREIVTCCTFLQFKLNIYLFTAGNWHKQNSRFCKEIREDNFRFWWRRVHEDASQGMYMSKIEILK
jgi:hypothetical protein